VVAPRSTSKLEEQLFSAASETSVSEGILLHAQPEDAPCRGDRDPFDVPSILIHIPIIHFKRVWYLGLCTLECGVHIKGT
jgi:hypothetical protein